MPRYYLHVRCGREFELDRDGVDFPDIETVKRETIAAAANVWRISRIRLDPAHFAVEVTDEFGTRSFRSRSSKRLPPTHRKGR